MKKININIIHLLFSSKFILLVFLILLLSDISRKKVQNYLYNIICDRCIHIDMITY